MPEAPPSVPPRDHVLAENVEKSFGPTLVLRGVTMHFIRGETTAILGGSGSGKSTLVRLLIGLEKPSAGHIWVDGEDIVPLGEREMQRVRRKFGMVFQHAALLDSLTVFDNVAFPLREHRRDLPATEVRDRVRAMLAILGLSGRDECLPAELSGGQRKRVGLARALMLDPKIILYDEPTSGLDPPSSRRVDGLIEETRRRFGVTSIVISHDMVSALRIAHRAYLMADGRIVGEGPPEVLASGENEVARSFFEASGIAAIEREPSGEYVIHGEPAASPATLAKGA